MRHSRPYIWCPPSAAHWTRRSEQVKNVSILDLINQLPHELAHWSDLFGPKPAVEAEEREFLLREPAFMAAVEKNSAELVTPLADYGLTPRSIYLAASGISMLIDRLADRQMLQTLPYVRLNLNQSPSPLEEGKKSIPNTLAPETAVGEVGRMARCSERVAGRLYRWLVGVSPQVKQLLPGFSAQGETAGSVLRLPAEVQLFPARQEGISIVDQWSVVSPPNGLRRTRY